MMERTAAIKEAAQAIRPYLESLVGNETARAMDAQLANLLGTSAEADELLAQLVSDERTHQWWLDFVRCECIPPEIAPVGQDVRSQLPGIGLPLLPRYACGRGDYVWYRRSPAITVPNCPTHDAPIQYAPRTV
jgi:hypothetical protein